MTCDTEILGAAGRFGVNSLSTAVSGRDEKIQRQKEVLLVPLIISLLQIHRTIPRFWSAYNKSPCKQQGLFVKA